MRNVESKLKRCKSCFYIKTLFETNTILEVQIASSIYSRVLMLYNEFKQIMEGSEELSLAIEERVHLSRVAQGLEKADLVLKEGLVANVHTGEIIPASVSISGGRIAAVIPSGAKEVRTKEVMSAKGYLLVPGYIEPHSHPWVVYNPFSLGRWSLPRGTTAHITDNLPFFQHGGPDAFLYLAKELKKAYPRYYWAARAVPQSWLLEENTLFSTKNITTLLAQQEVIAVAEITRWGELLEAVPSLMDKISFAAGQGKRIDGHTSGCKNSALNALVALGVSSCHEPISVEETLERLRLGMWVMLRNSSLRPDLFAILAKLVEARVSLDRVMMTTDAAEPVFLYRNGFTDGLLRVASQAGVNFLSALRMVTLAPAMYYGLEDDIGSITPGRFADILFLENSESFQPQGVMVEGKLEAWDNSLLNSGNGPAKMKNISEENLHLSSTFQFPSCLESLAALAPQKGKVPLIKLISSGITELDYLEWDGNSLPAEVQYCCLLGRRGEYLKSCFIHGFASGLQGLACSFTTSMGVLLIGNSLEAMLRAAARLFKLQGGIILWEGDSCLYQLPLELAGMMSTLELDEVAGRLKTLYILAQQRGFKYNDLLLCLLFLSCDFLPSVRITPLGVLDVKKRKIIS